MGGQHEISGTNYESELIQNRVYEVTGINSPNVNGIYRWAYADAPFFFTFPQYPYAGNVWKREGGAYYLYFHPDIDNWNISVIPHTNYLFRRVAALGIEGEYLPYGKVPTGTAIVRLKSK